MSTSAPIMFHTNMKVSRMPMSAWNLMGENAQVMTPAAVAAGEPAEPEHAETRLDLDLLFERSNKLRGTVATARSTTFGNDN